MFRHRRFRSVSTDPRVPVHVEDDDPAAEQDANEDGDEREIGDDGREAADLMVNEWQGSHQHVQQGVHEGHVD